MTARLPTPGGDDGDWGDILNAYLEVSHASDGTLNSGVVGNAQLDSATVTIQCSGRYGLNTIGSDVQANNCNIGVSAQHNLLIQAAGGVFTGCKFWYAGYSRSRPDGVGDVSTSGSASYDGIHVNGADDSGGDYAQFVGCQTQDNGRAGIYLDNANEVVVKGHVDAGSMYRAAYFLGVCRANDFDISMMSGTRATTPTGVTFDDTGGSPQYNRLRIINDYGSAPAKLFEFINGASGLTNTIDLCDAGILAIPGQFGGGYFVVNPTASVNTVAVTVSPSEIGGELPGWAPPGKRVTLIITQDSTGHPVTWESPYFVNPPAVSTTANAVTIAEFVNTATDGTMQWQYVA